MGKKFTAILLMLSMLLSLAACAGDEPALIPAKETSEGTESTLDLDDIADRLTIAFVNGTGIVPYTEMIMDTDGSMHINMYDGEGGNLLETYYISTNGQINDSNGNLIDLEAFTYAGESTTTNVPARTIDWQEYSYTSTDSKGYKIKSTVRLGEWMQYNDKDAWKSVWDEISNGREFPASPFKIGSQEFRDASGLWVVQNTDNIIFTVGTFEFENETENFDFSTSNDYTATLSFGIETHRADMTVLYSSDTKSYRVNSIENFSQGTGVMTSLNPPSGHMVSNKWGPCPFVIFVSQEVTPNDPDGTPNASEISLFFGGESIQLPVTWD